MEFTYEGLVRFGFGFYNPNHAASFICAIAPFAWILLLSQSIWKKCLGSLLSLAFIAALAFTYSRAGFVVLFAEAAVFWGVRKNWKIPLAIFALLFAAFAFSGGLGRMSYDSAMANRWDIWLAGFELFSANPFGVGLGNSGKIASAFILPGGIECRTMVNSHLTFLCEFGVLAAFPFFAAAAYAFLNGIAAVSKSAIRLAVFTSFCGLLLSGAFSSIFDLEPMFRPSWHPYMTPLNIAMQWVLFVGFILIMLILIFSKLSWKRMISSLLASAFVLLLCFTVGSIGKKAPEVDCLNGDAFVSVSDPTTRVVFFDDSYGLKSAAALLKKLGMLENCKISADSWQHKSELPDLPAKEYVFIGSACEFSNMLPDGAECVLICPGRFFELPKAKVKKVYLPQWDSRYDGLREQCKVSGIACDYM